MSDDLSQALAELKHNLRRYRRLIISIVAVIGGIWLFQSIFYTVKAEEEGVVLRFGRHVASTPPGLHTKYPWPVDQVILVPIESVQKLEFGFNTVQARRRTQYGVSTSASQDVARMLTGDLNLAHVEWAVHYRINDAERYLFALGSEHGRGGVRDQRRVVEETIRDVSESVMRQLVGNVSVDEVLTTGRDKLAGDAKKSIQDYLDGFECGISILAVKLQTVSPPELVKDAFDSVNRARQRKEQVVNEARGERNRRVPEARGKRDRVIAEAEGYLDRVVKTATGRAHAFLAKLAEYRKAPDVTRTRLYLETMEKVMSEVDDITILDESVGSVLPLLDLTGSGAGPLRGKGGAR